MQISSTIAFRTKPSFCYSTHDYHLLNHRVNRTQSCNCCSFPTLGVPSNPRFFYDSTLIRSLITKKLIFGRKNHFLRQPLCNFDSLNTQCCNVRRSCECCCNRRRENECCKRYCDSSSNFDKVCCGNSCNGRDSFSCCNMNVNVNVNVNGRIRKQGRLKCVIWEDMSESCDSGGGGNIDEMLDLLIVDKMSAGSGKRNNWLSDGRVQVDKRRDDGREREKYVKSSYGQRDSRGRFESSAVKTKEEECRFCGRGDVISRGKSNGLRKEESKYSVFVSDEVEKTDVDTQVNHGRRSGVSLSKNKQDLKRFDEDVSVKNVIEQSTKSNYDAVGSTSAAVASDNRLRNEREKRFTDVSILREDSQVESSNVMDSRRRDSETRLTTQSRLSDRQDDSGLATYLIDETRLQISQQDGLRRDSQRLTERSKIQNDDIEQTSISSARFRQREETSAASMNVSEKKEERHSQASQSTAELQRKSSNVMGTRRRDSGIRDTTENRVSDRQDNLGLNTYLIDETRSQISQQDELRRDSRQLTERSQIKNNDIEQTSISKARFRQREETSAASMNVSEKKEELYSQTSQSIAELQRKSQQLSESESRDNRIRNTSISHTRFESASKNREDNSTSSFQEAEKKEMHSDRHLRDIRITEQDQNLSDMSVISGNDKAIKNTSQKVIERRTHPEEEISASYVSQMSSNHDSDIRRTSTSQRLSESVLKNREESSTSLLASVSEAEERNQTAERVAWDLKSTKYSEDPKHTSETTSYDTTISSDSNKYFERKMSSRQENSSSLVDWGTEDGVETQHVTYPIKQSGSRIHSEGLTETSFFQESSANRSSSSQSSVLNQQKIEQQRDEQMEFGRILQVMVTPPPSQILHRTSNETVLHQRSNTGNTAGVVYSETADSGSSTIYTEEITPSSPHDFIGQTSLGNNNQSLSNVMLHADVLGSANRLEESSTQFFGQFVEELNQEASTSELAVGKISSEQSSSNKDAEDAQHALNQHVPDDVRSQVHDSRKSSSSSGARGPSDKVWDIAGPYSEERARDEDTSEVSSSTKTAIGRTNRSLWGIIGDIVRFRWRARSEARTPSTKSRGKSSSNQSVGSEGWFSSHEVDEKSDENVKKRKIIMPKLPGNSDQPLKTEAEPLGGVSEGTSADNTVLVTEADRFTSLDIVKGGTSASSTSKVESRRVDDKSNQGIISSTPTPSTSSPLPSKHFMRSPAVRGEVFVSSKAMSSRSDSGQMEQLVQKRPTEGSGTEMKDGELKQRKLHRNKQVEKETFEDWEEAYRIESEQRIIDEMFMKEAILEAKKAADTWEVPVGAVLVQHGKIIARGCNLVEELRDSTAHAEMICIREASKTLQTWRLAETTLYVTLEPCAMCAGAILQSRIDTVVYGAPNKLLGADGSWVRLFPGSSDAGGSSDLTSQLGGPIHPFHPKITLRRGILATECADVMQQFFQLRRKKAKKSDSPPTPPSSRILSHPSTLISKMHHIFNVMFCL